jgi:hypothetical protein
MKDQYHTFENEGRKAEVFLDTTDSPKGVWLVECSENDNLIKSFEVINEASAEEMSDEWVMSEISILK